jgi:hypothetical protein
MQDEIKPSSLRIASIPTGTGTTELTLTADPTALRTRAQPHPHPADTILMTIPHDHAQATKGHGRSERLNAAASLVRALMCAGRRNLSPRRPRLITG